MKEFKSIPDAFAYFMENVLPKLPQEARRKLKDVKYDYNKEGRKVSEVRMKRILSTYGSFETVHRYEWKEGE